MRENFHVETAKEKNGNTKIENRENLDRDVNMRKICK